MSLEIKLLVWSAALAFVQMLVAVTGAFLQVGLPTLAGNRENMKELPGWAGRADRAHFNMMINLTLFAILVLVAQVTGRLNRRRLWARRSSSGRASPMRSSTWLDGRGSGPACGRSRWWDCCSSFSSWSSPGIGDRSMSKSAPAGLRMGIGVRATAIKPAQDTAKPAPVLFRGGGIRLRDEQG
jgi:hypothetical protein